jgi:hypothetical protein
VSGRELWTRVDELLDQRLDPLDDDGIVDQLANDPHALAEYVRLRSALERLPVRSRWMRPALAGAVLLTLVAAATFYLTRPDADPAQVVARALTVPATEVAAHVVAFRISVVETKPGVRSTTTIDGAGYTHAREYTTQVPRGMTPTPGLMRATLTTTFHGALP